MLELKRKSVARKARLEKRINGLVKAGAILRLPGYRFLSIRAKLTEFRRYLAGETSMQIGSVFGFVLRAGALFATISGAQAFDDAKFPTWKGQWMRLGDARWDVSKPRRAQEAPLTPEYQARLEANLADMAAGGQGNNLMSKCVPAGMPRMALQYNVFEFLFFPDTTYIVQEHFGELRRVYTDGRPWPQNFKPTFSGYSLGRWLDEDADGRYDALLIETRLIGGPRSFDDNGLPLHDNNQTIVKEYLHLDRSNPELLTNEITTIDNALTRPWTVVRNYQRRPQIKWFEHPCEPSYSLHLFIGGENYFSSADGLLMPARKGQPAPDMRYFDPPK
jgi:hypothetical protein